VILVAGKRKKAVPARAKGRAVPAKKQISLSYPKPNDIAGRVRVEPPDIPPPSAPIDISPSSRMKEASGKKSMPYKATSAGGAFVISGALALFFVYVINLDPLFSLCLALPFFIGLSILFYEFLEFSERTNR